MMLNGQQMAPNTEEMALSSEVGDIMCTICVSTNTADLTAKQTQRIHPISQCCLSMVVNGWQFVSTIYLKKSTHIRGPPSEINIVSTVKTILRHNTAMQINKHQKNSRSYRNVAVTKTWNSFPNHCYTNMHSPHRLPIRLSPFPNFDSNDLELLINFTEPIWISI